MKKHFSVFMLMARFAFWPALIVSLGASAAMFVCMLFFGERADELYLNSSSDDFFFPARIVLYVGLVLLVVLLMRSMRERGGVQPGYTLRRLGVSEFAAFAWQGLAAALAVFVYFAFAAAALFGYALCYQAQGLGEAGNLSALVMLYGSRTAHALMPLADAAVYVRMAMFCLAIGLGCSYSSLLSRHGKRFSATPFVVVALALVFLPAAVGEGVAELLLVLGALAVITFIIAGARLRRYDGEDEEEGTADGEAV